MDVMSELQKQHQVLMKRERNRRTRNVLLAFIPPILVFVVWEVGGNLGVVDPRLFSSPPDVFRRAGEMMVNGELLDAVTTTLLRFARGFFFGALGGIIFGLAMGASRTFERILGPSLAAVYAVPKIALLPLLMLLFGIGETSNTMVVFLATFFVVTVSTETGIRHLPSEVVEAGVVYGARGWRRFIYVLVPGSLPSIFGGLRVAAGLAMISVVAIEFVAARDGLGQLIWRSWTLLQPEPMFVGLVVVAALGAGIIRLVQIAGERLTPWVDGRSKNSVIP